jgi:uncharacterized membrane protein (UPF0182 family)
MQIAPSKPRLSPWLISILGLFVVGVLLQVAVGLWIDGNWFAHLGYGQVWLLNRVAPWGLGITAFLGLVIWLSLNLRVAWPQARPLWRGLVIVIPSGVVAAVAMNHWFTFLVALFQQRVESTDPVLHHDISFYLFSLPLLLQLQRWGLGLGLLTLALVALCYGLRRHHLTPELQQQLLRQAQRHLLGLGGLVLLAQGLGHWLARYTLMYSNRGSFAGANYTDVHVQMPADVFLTMVAIISAIALFYLALFTPGLAYLKTDRDHQAYWFWYPHRGLILLVILGGYGLAAIGLAFCIPNWCSESRWCRMNWSAIAPTLSTTSPFPDRRTTWRRWMSSPFKSKTTSRPKA